MRTFRLADGSEIPAIGLGTWKLKPDIAGEVVTKAIDIGYRHFDCASVYNNQRAIGAGLQSAISTGKVRREEIWVTSKLWSNAHAPKHVRPALERTLFDLRLDYLDLYLIHWPVSIQADIIFPKRVGQFIPENELPLTKTWKAMEKMVEKGLCRNIGVCNCNIRRLGEIQRNARIQPAMNQIELHPYLQQPAMLDYCAKHSILVTAYSPLGSGAMPETAPAAPSPSLLDHPLVQELARGYGATPARLLLAWGLNRNTVVIPRSSQDVHLKDNLRALGLQLDSSTMELMEQLEINHRFLDGRFWAPPGSPYSVEAFWQQ